LWEYEAETLPAHTFGYVSRLSKMDFEKCTIMSDFTDPVTYYLKHKYASSKGYNAVKSALN